MDLLDVEDAGRRARVGYARPAQPGRVSAAAHPAAVSQPVRVLACRAVPCPSWESVVIMLIYGTNFLGLTSA